MPDAIAGLPGAGAAGGSQLDELEALAAQLDLDWLDLGDLVHDIYSARAAAVNNEGLRAQLAEILGEFGGAAAGVLDDLRPLPVTGRDEAQRIIQAVIETPPVGPLFAPWYAPDIQVSDHHALNQIAYWLRDPDWGAGLLEDIAAVVASTGRPPRDCAEGHVLLCDGCFQQLTGQPARCQAQCSQPPGHTGICAAAGRDAYARCDHCGHTGRLTETDADVAGLDPPAFWERH
jgi:hypothetical protein